MKSTRWIWSVVLVGAAVFAGHSVEAAVPQVLTQQGRLIDKATSKPVAGTISITFALYDVASGGTALWTEKQDVTLDDGYFSARLGETTAIPKTVFNGSVRYLGVTVGTDTEMSPREPLTSVPYAMVAGDVNGPINPASVSIAGTKVIDETGKWVGPPIAAAAATWPTPGFTLPFMPLNGLAGCAVSPVAANTAGSTTSTTNVSIGTMYFEQSATWLKSSYTKGRLQVVCRGNGVIELRTGSCGTVVATINCTSGTRPWTAASAEFTVSSSTDYDVVARATSGSLEWSQPQLVLY